MAGATLTPGQSPRSDRRQAKSKVFIVGPGRSGTTVLAELLGRSSLLYVAPETKFFQQVWGQRRILNRFSRSRRAEVIAEHLARVEYSQEEPVFPQIRNVILRCFSGTDDLHDAFGRMLDSLSDKPMVGEKTPWHLFFVDQLVRVAPDCRIIAITRDAPATVASTWRRAGFRRVGSIRSCVARWILMNKELLRLRDELSRSQFRLVFLEELIADPRRTLTEVCAFLEIPLEERMLVPTGQDSSLRASTSTGGWDPGVLERWRRTLNPEQVSYICGLTWEVSRALGYDVSPVVVGVRERAALRAELVLLKAGVLLMQAGLHPFGAWRMEWSRLKRGGRAGVGP